MASDKYLLLTEYDAGNCRAARLTGAFLLSPQPRSDLTSPLLLDLCLRTMNPPRRNPRSQATMTPDGLVPRHLLQPIQVAHARLFLLLCVRVIPSRLVRRRRASLHQPLSLRQLPTCLHSGQAPNTRGSSNTSQRPRAGSTTTIRPRALAGRVTGRACLPAVSRHSFPAHPLASSPAARANRPGHAHARQASTYVWPGAAVPELPASCILLLSSCRQ